MTTNNILGYFNNDGHLVDITECDYVQLELNGQHAKQKNSIILISKDSLQLVSKFNWFLGKDGYPVAYQSHDKKIKLGRGLKLHKMLMPYCYKGYVIDHINRNKLDNRLANLRMCTPKQNSYNTTKPSNSKQKFKGVKKGKNGTWTAYVTKDKETFEIKDISDEKEAAKIYDMMAEDLFGKYAGKNFDYK